MKRRGFLQMLGLGPAAATVLARAEPTKIAEVAGPDLVAYNVPPSPSPDWIEDSPIKLYSGSSVSAIVASVSGGYFVRPEDVLWDDVNGFHTRKL